MRVHIIAFVVTTSLLVGCTTAQTAPTTSARTRILPAPKAAPAAENITVPDVVGLTTRDGIDVLEAAGLRAEVRLDYAPAEIPAGSVLSTSPRPGVLTTASSVITITEAVHPREPRHRPSPRQVPATIGTAPGTGDRTLGAAPPSRSASVGAGVAGTDARSHSAPPPRRGLAPGDAATVANMLATLDGHSCDWTAVRVDCSFSTDAYGSTSAVSFDEGWITGASMAFAMTPSIEAAYRLAGAEIALLLTLIAPTEFERLEVKSWVRAALSVASHNEPIDGRLQTDNGTWTIAHTGDGRVHFTAV